MTLWRSRRRTQKLAIAALAAAICWIVPLVPAALPLADGPRVLRQYVVALLPCLLAPLLVDPFADISSSWARTRSVLLQDRALCLLIGWGSLAPAWYVSGVSGDEVLFEASTLAALMAFVMIGTWSWGSPAVLAASILGCIWLLAGNTLAELIGFGDFSTGWRPGLSPMALTVVVAAIASQLIAVFWGLSPLRRPVIGDWLGTDEPAEE